MDYRILKTSARNAALSDAPLWKSSLRAEDQYRFQGRETGGKFEAMADEAARMGFIGAISAGPLGMIARLLWFLLLCLILFVIGLVKAAIFGPLAALIFFLGVVAVVIGLWPLHVVIIFRAVAMTKKIGVVLKILLIILLPIPVLLWPFGAAVGSLLTGLGYGVGQPLVATFEAVGEDRENKFYHTFVNGTVSTVIGAFKFVRDFFDFIYHSVSESIQEFRLGEPKNGKPTEITLRELPLCVLIGLLGLLVDTPAICLVALGKMPLMLYKGWRRLLGDLVDRNISCLEVACVPFAGLAIAFWPLFVVGSLITASVCSPFLGLYSAVVVYQEMSYKCGLKYIVAIISEFDEYTSDFLHAQEGSCLPRPKYRKSKGTSKIDAAGTLDIEGKSARNLVTEIPIPQLITQKSLRQALKEVKLVHILESKFAVIDREGRALIDAGILKHADVEAALKGDKIRGKMMLEGLPAHSLLNTIMRSAKSNSPGLILMDGTEVTMSNRPSDRLVEWFFEPIITLKDQVRAAHLQETEERYLEKLILMRGETERTESWQNGGVEPEDDMRKGELQALARRIYGISNSVSRVPTHRRRLENVMKNLQEYIESRDDNSERSPKAPPNKSKSMKRAQSANFRSMMREGSRRFLPTTGPASERQGNPEDSIPNVDRVV